MIKYYLELLIDQSQSRLVLVFYCPENAKEDMYKMLVLIEFYQHKSSTYKV